MNKIIVYENCDFKGLSREFTSNVSDLAEKGFNNCISSLKVIGNPWVAYEQPEYYGSFQVYEEGEYATVESNDTYSSLELLTEDLTNPQITLYDHRYYQGRQLVLKNETNLWYSDFNDIASSYKVQKGVWLLYENTNKTGDRMLARPSLDAPFIGNLSYLVPLKPGTSSVSAEVLWDKKEEQVQSVVIDSITSVNRTSHEQTFTTQLVRDYESSVTDTFSFSNSTEIGLGVSFEINLGMFYSETNFTLSNTFTVEKGSSNTRTEKQRVSISLPAIIYPHTKLTVNVLRKQVSVKVPVKLVITTGSQSKVEYGEYRCQSGESITTEYDEEEV